MQNQMMKVDEKEMRAILRREDVLGQFESILGKTNAAHYIGTVAIAYANSPDLQECHPDSIVRSALRCAAMELSCDPVAKQGQLVPYWNSKRGRKEAQLIVHYKGLVLLAQRSGLYRYINVSKIYEGYEVDQDILTGLHAVRVIPEKLNVRNVIGFLGYMETMKGFKKTVYWTIERIKEHAGRFASKNPLYNDPKHQDTMYEKTVIRDLMSWADLGGVNNGALTALENALDDGGEQEEIIPGMVETVEELKQAEITQEEAEYLSAYEFETRNGEKYGKMENDYLQSIIDHPQAPEEKRRAAQIILNWRKAKASKEQKIMQDLGFDQ